MIRKQKNKKRMTKRKNKIKSVYILAFLLLSSLFLYAQDPVKPDTTIPAKRDTTVPAKADTVKRVKGNDDKQLEEIKARKVQLHSDSAGNEPKKSALVDTTVTNKYGDLLVDDTAYNKRYHFWRPTIEVLGIFGLTWAVDRYALNADYARIGISTWQYNLKEEWEWDHDRFGINFIAHPYSGSLTFNAARSNGYNFLQSFPFALAGSLMWEYFGENTRPSFNDVINTPVNGAFLGEILYRLSSNLLDDRSRGANRVFREIAAGLVDPIRGFNRLLQGKTFRITNKEVYEKEPLNISIYAGLHRINDLTNDVFGRGTNSGMINLQFDYGNPFEIRSRKPFDFFRLRVDLNFGVGRKYLDNVTGYGILFGKNYQVAKLAINAGGFQYYDYWDNKEFELGAIAFGGGVFTKLPISKTSNLYTNLHLGIIPFAGNSTRFGPDTSQVRDYNFGDGFMAKFESTITLGKYATGSMVFYYYLIHTYIGSPGNNYIAILKPRVTIRIYKPLNIGFEYFVYYNDRYITGIHAIHSMQTEQKVFLLLYLEDKQRRGQYN